MLGKRCYTDLTLNKLPSGWLLLQIKTKLPSSPGRMVVVALQEAAYRRNPQLDISPLEHTGRGERQDWECGEGVCRSAQAV